MKSPEDNHATEPELADATPEAKGDLDRRLILLLRVATVSCFAAWAWQHLRWIGPYGSTLWNPVVFGFVENFGIHWDTWINGIMTEERVLLISRTDKTASVQKRGFVAEAAGTSR